MSNNIYDILILGSGPAGLTAGIYACRACRKTLMIGGYKPGGQLMLTTEVENYPGFPDGVLGGELMAKMRKQAEKFGLQIIDMNVSKVDFSNRPFKVWINEQVYEAKSVIIATGTDTKWLGLQSEKRLIGHGVSTCATCDAFFYRDKDVIVVGGGDTAFEEAIYLTKFAKSITIVHRREDFRASAIMVDRAKNNQKISFILNSTIEDILGSEKVSGVKIKNLKSGEVTEKKADGVFIAIGHIPNTEVFKGQIEMDEKGYIVKQQATSNKQQAKDNKYQMMTNIEGVFVAGDVHDHQYMQAVTAASFGVMAAIEAERWLMDSNK